MFEICRLGLEHLPQLDTFLLTHSDTCLFQRSNLRAFGIQDEGKRLQGLWWGAFHRGELVGVLNHVNIGNVLVQAEESLPDLVQALLRETNKPIKGILGPHHQAVRCRELLGLGKTEPALDGKDVLMVLDTRELHLPELFHRPGVVLRNPTRADWDLLNQWHVEFSVEAVNLPDTPQLREEARAAADRQIHSTDAWLLEVNGQVVAKSAMVATLPDVVQIGGVYTPLQHRGHGYAKAVVGGSIARGVPGGLQRAVLFTGEDNTIAQRAYTSIGFRPVGYFGLILFG